MLCLTHACRWGGGAPGYPYGGPPPPPPPRDGAASPSAPYAPYPQQASVPMMGAGLANEGAINVEKNQQRTVQDFSMPSLQVQ